MVEVEVASGSTGRAVGEMLVERKVVASSEAFVDALGERSAVLTPGTFVLNEEMSAAAAVDALTRTDTRVETRVTLREGLTTRASLEAMAAKTNAPVAELEAALAGATRASWANGLEEALMFPATYDASAKTSAELVQEALDTADERYRGVLVDAGVEPSDEALRVALTKASLVQAEAGSVGDMRRVARVIENRLALGMKLEFDSTVHYAVGGAKDVTTTSQERDTDSPFNTYRYAGLPPAPINAPGLEALKAVLSPEEGDWLFFVTTNPSTGETVFSSTYDQHLVAVEEYRQWLRER